jgi:hypothetical protein
MLSNYIYGSQAILICYDITNFQVCACSCVLFVEDGTFFFCRIYPQPWMESGRAIPKTFRPVLFFGRSSLFWQCGVVAKENLMCVLTRAFSVVSKRGRLDSFGQKGFPKCIKNAIHGGRCLPHEVACVSLLQNTTLYRDLPVE